MISLLFHLHISRVIDKVKKDARVVVARAPAARGTHALGVGGHLKSAGQDSDGGARLHCIDARGGPLAPAGMPVRCGPCVGGGGITKANVVVSQRTHVRGG